MKRIIVLFVIVFLFAGCNNESSEMHRAAALRDSLAQCKQFQFTAKITADYEDRVHHFSLDCQGNSEGEVSFTVIEPDSISDISGTLSASGGKLTFDDKLLAFPMLADGELSPVSAPWLLIKALLSGYLSSCGADGQYLRLTIDDSYEEDALQLDIWLGSNELPVHAEILWQGRKILTMDVENFTIL